MDAMKVTPGGWTLTSDDIMGIGVPDAFHTVWATSCHRTDLDRDGLINVDMQMIASRYGAFVGNPETHWRYDARYDIQPALRADWDIDIMDVQRVSARFLTECL